MIDQTNYLIFNREKPELPIILENPIIMEISKRHNKTPAQVALKWALQRDLVVLPKSVTPSRIQENIQVIAFLE